MFSTFLFFLLVISLFKMAPKYSAEVLSRFAMHKKAVTSLTEKRPVLDKLGSGTRNSMVSRDFNAN